MSRRAGLLVAGISAVVVLATGCTPAQNPSASPAVEWRESFDGPAGAPVEPAHWSSDVGNIDDDGWGNDELQWYTEGSANAALDGDGHLTITADRASAPEHQCSTVQVCPFVSARLTTRDKVALRAGRVEVTAKLPTDVGLLPAIWLLGTGEWPHGGEIDIAEVVGGEPEVVNGSAHGPGYSDDDGPTRTTRLDESASSGFHRYAVDKRSDEIRWSVDGQEYFVLHRSDLDPALTWVLDRPMALVLNIAVGGTWPGDPDASSHFPARMVVDDVVMTGDIVFGN